MFSVNDCVVYGSSGVTRIVDITKECVGGEPREYYVLTNVFGATDSKTFVPVDNEKLVSSMRHVKSKEEMEKVISTVDLPQVAWVKDTRARSERFRLIIESTDVSLMISMLKTIKETERQRLADGKNPFVTDTLALQKAVRILSSEISLAFSVDEEAAADILRKNCPFLVD